MKGFEVVQSIERLYSQSCACVLVLFLLFYPFFYYIEVTFYYFEYILLKFNIKHRHRLSGMYRTYRLGIGGQGFPARNRDITSFPPFNRHEEEEKEEEEE